MKKQTPKKNRGFTLIELMVVVAIIGVLAAIAIPNFLKFQAKSKQSEAKTNLKALWTAEKSYYSEKDRFSDQLAQVGFRPEGGNRYNYTVGGGAGSDIPQDPVRFPQAAAVPGGYSTVTGPVNVQSQPGVTADGNTFMAAAYGNVDNDTNSDVWTLGSDVNTQTPSACAHDAQAAGGAPLLTYDDVSCP